MNTNTMIRITNCIFASFIIVYVVCMVNVIHYCKTQPVKSTRYVAHKRVVVSMGQYVVIK